MVRWVWNIKEITTTSYASKYETRRHPFIFTLQPSCSSGPKFYITLTTMETRMLKSFSNWILRFITFYLTSILRYVVIQWCFIYLHLKHALILWRFSFAILNSSLSFSLSPSISWLSLKWTKTLTNNLLDDAGLLLLFKLN